MAKFEPLLKPECALNSDSRTRALSFYSPFLPNTLLKLLIAEDHPVVIQGLEKVASDSGLEIQQTVASPERIVEVFDELKPDVLVTEVRLQGRDAIKAVEELRQQYPDSVVVVFSYYDNPSYIARAAAIGCHEYLLKTAGCHKLVEAVRNGASGGATPTESLLLNLRRRMVSKTGDHFDSPLTNREHQVLKHVSMGLSNREIGKSLGISVETVKEHVQNILRKLDVNDRTQAAVWAVRKGLI